MSLSKLLRVAAAALAIAIATPALAGSPVEEFANQTIDKGLTLLNNKALTGPARDAAIRDFLKSTLDIKRIALFTLGSTAQSTSPDEIAAYQQSFEAFTLASYVSRVGTYGGQSLKVIDVAAHGPGDFIVTVQVVDPAASPNDPPDTAQFRVLQEPAGCAVVDASVEGVWFEIAQRSDIQGYLEQNGGSIPKLIDHLNQMTADINAGR
jgi:ABC-type transporter MlaC component